MSCLQLQRVLAVLGEIRLDVKVQDGRPKTVGTVALPEATLITGTVRVFGNQFRSRKHATRVRDGHACWRKASLLAMHEHASCIFGVHSLKFSSHLIDTASASFI
jgi:hypothetical protein